MNNNRLIFYFLVTLIGILSINCSDNNGLHGDYEGFFYDTYWNLHLSNNQFSFESSGHLEGSAINGEFVIHQDTLVLLTEDDHYPTKFLIDGDSCLIDIEMHVDYCKYRSDQKEWWGSRWRSINYPQIKTDDLKTIENVHRMIESVLNRNEILKYFPDSIKSIVVQEYYELNKESDLKLESHGSKVIFLSEEEISAGHIDEYLIIDDIRIGQKTGHVDFQVMPEFSGSIYRYFTKENNEWVMDGYIE